MKKETLFVAFTKDPVKSSFLRVHRGINLVVETDPSMSKFVILSFSNRTVRARINRLLKRKGYRLVEEDHPNWLTGLRSEINVETLLAHILDYLREAGYDVLTSDDWTYVPEMQERKNNGV